MLGKHCCNVGAIIIQKKNQIASCMNKNYYKNTVTINSIDVGTLFDHVIIELIIQ